MAKQSISARTVNGWINDMDVTKSWTETEMDGQRGPDGYPNVINVRCKVCSEFRVRLKNVRNFSTLVRLWILLDKDRFSIFVLLINFGWLRINLKSWSKNANHSEKSIIIADADLLHQVQGLKNHLYIPYTYTHWLELILDHIRTCLAGTYTRVSVYTVLVWRLMWWSSLPYASPSAMHQRRRQLCKAIHCFKEYIFTD